MVEESKVSSSSRSMNKRSNLPNIGSPNLAGVSSGRYAAHESVFAILPKFIRLLLRGRELEFTTSMLFENVLDGISSFLDR